MGLRGAALATVISRSLVLLMSLLILRYREDMIEFALPTSKRFLESCRTVLHVGAPAAATNALTPISMAVATRIVAGYGPDAVAAVGTGTRLETFSILGLMALATSLAPFAGQNWGAGFRGRVREAQNVSNRFCLAWGAGCVALYWFAADWAASFFGDDPEIARFLALYMRIASLGFGFRGVCQVTASSFNAIGKPGRAAALNFARMFVLYAPLSLLGSRLFGLAGVFAGMALANVLAGVAALAMLRRTCGADSEPQAAPESAPAMALLEESGAFEDELEAEAVGGAMAE
jgi:Na+-driven multidrug efflux pump